MNEEILTILKKAPAVIAVLTSERTREKLFDLTEYVDDAKDAVMEASQSAAEDVVSIFEEILAAMDVINTTRYLPFPKDAARLERVRNMLKEVELTSSDVISPAE